MHNFISPDTFLKIQDEITLRNTIVRLDNIMEVNDKELDDISKDGAMHKVQELYLEIQKLEDLRNKAVMHQATGVFDDATDYITKLEIQMSLFRSKYM